MKRVVISIGGIAVSQEPAQLETVLGSCVAVCLWDRASRIGAINHYLLPHEQANAPRSTVYGATSIGRLVGEMIRAGADIYTMEAQIYGGGSVIEGLDDLFGIGQENVRIARRTLEEYGIPVVQEQVFGREGIRVVFRTATGEAAVLRLGPAREGGCSRTAAVAAHKGSRPCRSCISCGSCA
jgi:chemotaxis protein CheD